LLFGRTGSQNQYKNRYYWKPVFYFIHSLILP